MSHRCHATGCNLKIPPRLLMCKAHWFMVPAPIRDWVWGTYKPGQEVKKNPSEEYMNAYRAAVNAVDKKEGRELTFPEADHGS